jgi:hypothetical protein
MQVRLADHPRDATPWQARCPWHNQEGNRLRILHAPMAVDEAQGLMTVSTTRQKHMLPDLAVTHVVPTPTNSQRDSG